jgi:hypothetical protein
MPITRSLDPCQALNFSVAEGGRTYAAQISWKPTPQKIMVSGVIGGGLNKIALDFTAKEVTVELKPLSQLLVLDVRESKYLYPIIAVAASSLYLWLKHLALKRRQE